MKRVVTRSLFLLIGVCLFMVFSGISSKACDKNQLTKYGVIHKKTRQVNITEVNPPAELTDFIFANSLLRF